MSERCAIWYNKTKEIFLNIKTFYYIYLNYVKLVIEEEFHIKLKGNITNNIFAWIIW